MVRSGRRAAIVLLALLLIVCWVPLWCVWDEQHREMQALRTAVSRLSTERQALDGINNLPLDPNTTDDPEDEIERLQAELNRTNVHLFEETLERQALSQRVDDLTENVRSSTDDIQFKLGKAAGEREALAMLLNRTSARLSGDEVELHAESLKLEQLDTNVTNVQFWDQRLQTDSRNEALRVSALRTNLSRVSWTIDNVSSTGLQNLAARVANVSSRLDHVQSVDASTFAADAMQRKALAGQLANVTAEVEGVDGLVSRVENVSAEVHRDESQEIVDAHRASRGQSVLQRALDNETHAEQADADVARDQRDALSHRIDALSADLTHVSQQAAASDAESSGDRSALSHRIDQVAAVSAEVNARQYVCAGEQAVCQCHGWVTFGMASNWCAWRRVNGEISCTDGVWGDPCVGTRKVCVCRP